MPQYTNIDDISRDWAGHYTLKGHTTLDGREIEVECTVENFSSERKGWRYEIVEVREGGELGVTISSWADILYPFDTYRECKQSLDNSLRCGWESRAYGICLAS